MDDALKSKLSSTPAAKALVDPLSKLTTALEATPAAEPDQHRHDRVSRLITLAELGLSVVDDALLTKNLVHPGVQALNGLHSQLSNSGSLRQADPHIESLADWVRTLPLIDLAYPLEAVHALLRDAQAELRQLRADHETAAGRFAEADAQMAAAIEEHLGRAERAERSLEEALQGGADLFNKKAEEQTALVQEDHKAIIEAAQDAVERANQGADEIAQRLGIVADQALSAGYDNAAIDEKKQADRYRTLTIAFGIATVLVTSLAVGASLFWGYDPNLGQLLAKVGLITALSSLGVYCGNEARSHRRQERTYRDTALRLRNLGHYLTELRPGSRAAVRKALVPEFFVAKGDTHLEFNDQEPPSEDELS